VPIALTVAVVSESVAQLRKNLALCNSPFLTKARHSRPPKRGRQIALPPTRLRVYVSLTQGPVVNLASVRQRLFASLVWAAWVRIPSALSLSVLEVPDAFAEDRPLLYSRGIPRLPDFLLLRARATGRILVWRQWQLEQRGLLATSRHRNGARVDTGHGSTTLLGFNRIDDSTLTTNGLFLEGSHGDCHQRPHDRRLVR
jgi:hypothetical protein